MSRQFAEVQTSSGLKNSLSVGKNEQLIQDEKYDVQLFGLAGDWRTVWQGARCKYLPSRVTAR